MTGEQKAIADRLIILTGPRTNSDLRRSTARDLAKLLLPSGEESYRAASKRLHNALKRENGEFDDRETM